MKQGGYPLCLGKMLDSMDPTSCVTASASSREISAANCHRIVHAVTYVQANFLELKAKGQTSAAAVREGSFSTGFAADDDFCLMASSARLILQLAFITKIIAIISSPFITIYLHRISRFQLSLCRFPCARPYSWHSIQAVLDVKQTFHLLLFVARN
jgi:hypothetical protein